MRYNNCKTQGFEPFASLIDDLLNTNIGDIVGGDISFNTPSANTRETDEAFFIDIAAPGVQKEDFKIKIQKDHLIVSSNIENKEGSAEEYKRREFDYSKFRRSFRLKDNIDRDQIKASYDLGVLTIRLPKLNAEKANKSTEITVE